MALRNSPPPDPNPVQLAFAWAPAEHRLVHISEARAGYEYLHPDPDLRLPLIPRKGLLRRHHFAHLPGSAAGVAAAAGIVAGGEGLRHLNFKLALVHRLQKSQPLTLTWRCSGCDRRQQANLRDLVGFETASWEVPFHGLRLDVGLLRGGTVVGAVEVHDSHAIDPTKAAALAQAVEKGDFRALELPVTGLPLRLPLRVERQFPRPLCADCQARRADWLAWAANHRPAVNFSGWQALPAEEQGCIRLGGGWATRGADSEALQPVLCWLEIVPRLDREILITALTVHRRRGRLRWRELRLRAPQGRPTRELEFQLSQAAQEFAAAAIKYRQRLTRADPEQLHRWLAAATPPPADPVTAQAVSVTAGGPQSLPGASAQTAPPAAPAPVAQGPVAAPFRRRGLAAWFDRLAHQTADWLEQGSGD